MIIVKTYKDFIKVGFASYASRAIGAIISILLARWLGPNDFGIFSIGFYVLTIFGLGFTGLDKFYVHSAVQSPEKKNEIFTTYCILKVIISLLIIFLGFTTLFFNMLKVEVEIKIILWGLIGGFGMQLQGIVLSYYQAHKNFHIFSRVQLLYYVILLFLVTAGIQLSIENLFYYLLIYTLCGIIIVLIFRKFKISLSGFNLEIAKKFWQEGKWLILYELFLLVNMRLDFFLLTKYYSGEVLGQYSVALKLVNIFAVLVGAFSVLLLPKASSMQSTEDLREYWRENRRIMVLLLLTWAVTFGFAPFIVKVLFGSQYSHAIPTLRILLFSVLPLIFIIPLMYIFMAVKKIYYLSNISAIQTLSLLLLIPLFINKMGMIGCAYGKAASFFLTLVIYSLMYIHMKKHIIENLESRNRDKVQY